jgi:hypothetical protein
LLDPCQEKRSELSWNSAVTWERQGGEDAAWCNKVKKVSPGTDWMAIVCFCLLGFSEAALSFEKLVSAVGLTAQLERRFTESEMTKWIEDGRRRYLQRSGLR